MNPLILHASSDPANVGRGDCSGSDGKWSAIEAGARTMLGVPENIMSSTYTPRRDGFAV